MVGGDVQISFERFDQRPDKNRQWRGAPKLPRKNRGGRPVPAGKRPSERHKTRAAFKPSTPIHIVMRVAPGISSLRDHAMYLAIRAATFTAFVHDDKAIHSRSASKTSVAVGRAFHIVHLSIQRTHIHMIVEASDRMALARGMQAFGISAARHINAVRTRRARASGRIRAHEKIRGQVFADRYHAVLLTTPRQVRNTLAYVLNNWRKHGESNRTLKHAWKVDPYSTAIQFGAWKERADRYTLMTIPKGYEGLLVWLPRTWLLQQGWRRYGLIGMSERPGLGSE